MVTSSKIYEVSTGRMVNNGTDKGLSCPAMPLAKSERQKVKTVTAGEAPHEGCPAHRTGPYVPGGSTNSGDPSRSGLTSPQGGKPVADSASPAISTKGAVHSRAPPGDRQTRIRTLHARPPGFTPGSGKPAGTRRLEGCTKGRDARRSQTARRPADHPGICPDRLRKGCASGRARCPHPFIAFIPDPVLIRRGAPYRCRHGRQDPNKRRTRANTRQHEDAAAFARRSAPRRRSIWERKC